MAIKDHKKNNDSWILIQMIYILLNNPTTTNNY
jgi:hypothetical protein